MDAGAKSHLELERSIDALDNKSTDLVREQWKLIKDHIATNARELVSLQKELTAMKQSNDEMRASFAGRLAGQEELVRTELKSLRQAAASNEAAVVAKFEKELDLSVTDLAQKIARAAPKDDLASVQSGLKEEQRAMQERFTALNRSLQDTVDHQLVQAAREMEELVNRLQTSFRESVDTIKTAQDAHRDTVSEQCALEKTLFEGQLKDAQKHFLSRLGDEKNARETQQSNLQELLLARLQEERQEREQKGQQYMEKLKGESQKREQEARALETQFDGLEAKVMQELQQYREAVRRHESIVATLQENCSKLDEQLSVEVGSRTAQVRELQELALAESSTREGQLATQQRALRAVQDSIPNLEIEVDTQVKELHESLLTESAARENQFNAVHKLARSIQEQLPMEATKILELDRKYDEMVRAEAALREGDSLVLQDAVAEVRTAVQAQQELLQAVEREVTVGKDRMTKLECILHGIDGNAATAAESDVSTKVEDARIPAGDGRAITVQERLDNLELRLQESLAKEVELRQDEVSSLHDAIERQKLTREEAKVQLSQRLSQVEKFLQRSPGPDAGLEERTGALECGLDDMMQRFASLRAELSGLVDQWEGHSDGCDKDEALRGVGILERLEAVERNALVVEGLVGEEKAERGTQVKELWQWMSSRAAQEGPRAPPDSSTWSFPRYSTDIATAVQVSRASRASSPSMQTPHTRPDRSTSNPTACLLQGNAAMQSPSFIVHSPPSRGQASVGVPPSPEGRTSLSSTQRTDFTGLAAWHAGVPTACCSSASTTKSASPHVGRGGDGSAHSSSPPPRQPPFLFATTVHKSLTHTASTPSLRPNSGVSTPSMLPTSAGVRTSSRGSQYGSVVVRHPSPSR
mmetsp:Transcript_58857/g.137485  ORF Transcript_58857/g.137485 Transcript_58857/m.137485 type:complete len:873 (-) Transcript_58857:109-2727(-)